MSCQEWTGTFCMSVEPARGMKGPPGFGLHLMQREFLSENSVAVCEEIVLEGRGGESSPKAKLNMHVSPLLRTKPWLWCPHVLCACPFGPEKF